jgi:hypothetical protein
MDFMKTTDDKRILAALEPTPGYLEGWNDAREAAVEACTNVIKNYDVMDGTGTKYLPIKTQKAAKDMVSIAREDILALTPPERPKP